MSLKNCEMNNNLVLIDTSVWIFALSKNFLPEIKQRVDTLLKENRVAICSMVKLERTAREVPFGEPPEKKIRFFWLPSLPC